MEISGTIKKAIYQNKENGYTVLRTTQDVTICGIRYDATANLNDADFTAIGEWQKHKSFGRQFQFETLTNTEGELLYFLSRIVKGLGRKLATIFVVAAILGGALVYLVLGLSLCLF